nr:hypothetical protein [Tanacetum cinerariifolium]
MAIDGVGWDWSYMANEGESHVLVADEEAPTEFALMAKTERKVFDNTLCSNECKKNTDSLNSKIKDLKSELSEANNYIYHYKLAVAQLEGRLTEYKEREVKYIEKIRTLEMYKATNLKCIKTLDKELEELKIEKDGLDGKLAGLLKALKNLDHLIESQRPSPTVASTSAEGQNQDSSTSENVASSNPPKPFVKFVKPKDSQPESKSKEQETPKKSQVKYAEQYRHSNKKPKETTRSQKYTYESPSHRFVGHRSHRPSMRPSYRPTGHRPHGSAMNPRRPSMNGARPRPFLKSSAVRTQYRSPWVPTVHGNNPPVSRKFSTGRRNFPTVTRKFPTAGRKFTTGSTKIHC